jgi:glyoxylase-like metal-dependent hydrolase (beta-lactamase superfamily II)
LGAVAAPGVAQQLPPLVVKPLKGGVYWSSGGVGGNTGIIVGQKGVIVIDAKTTAESAKEMLAEIAKITPKPVTTVILTHSDRDHVNGLAAFPKGVKVIAHENNKKEQEKALEAGGPGAPPRDYLPTQVVTKERETLQLEGVRVTLIHVTNAHTSGDLAVYLPAQKVVFTGDLIVTNRFDPLIHLEKNGSSDGWNRFVKTLAELNAESYVPGHGDLLGKAGVQNILTSTQDKRAKIVTMVGDGKSLDEIKASLGDKPEPVNPGSPVFASYTEVVYKELTKK